MQSIDYEVAAQQRRANYEILHNFLGKENNLKLVLDTDAVPMIYPYFAPVKGLREKLIQNKIFVARYWPNVLDWCKEDELEYLLAYQMQPLPIDLRYGEEEMNFIINQIQ
jgi:hypothetical protein